MKLFDLVEINLSPAEKEIVYALLKGFGPCAIAKIRGVSRDTVRKQLSNLYVKFGVHDHIGTCKHVILAMEVHKYCDQSKRSN